MSRIEDAKTGVVYVERGRDAERWAASGEERVIWTAGRKLESLDPRDVARQFEEARAAHDMRRERRVEQLVHHMVLSWAEGETPSEEEMLEVTRRVLEALGLAEHATWIAAHGDTNRAHLHALTCRVHSVDLSVWKGWQSLQTINGELRRIEEEKGWKTPAHGHHLAEHGYVPVPSRTYPESRAGHEKTGVETLRGRLRAEAVPLLEEAKSWKAFVEILSARSLSLVPRKSGLVVADEERTHVALSSLSRALSRRKVERQVGQTWEAYTGDTCFARWDAARGLPPAVETGHGKADSRKVADSEKTPSFSEQVAAALAQKRCPPPHRARR